jgi:hypothetical protein
MTKNSTETFVPFERTFIRFEMPVILSIPAFLLLAACAKVDHAPWRVATLILFSAAGLIVLLAIYVAARHHDRWV